ncbi:amino acid ABC transporter permease [Muricomes intestini]|jgi:polar amino acid transport system permease protein|uniref:Amino acid ABC transporter membrane protein (PAAT family) n=1 Tax=Muricomes intestini TaxID=1796634 RepID=A0A4R3K2B4_9FIRM|nr:amino acid ABC transporter permease [Muricomes intestini]TCS76411.1 amino acid ABC transporter membrane protein (PAAT family) [Muricomes intestini]HAX53220.1 amino acid ABC transporter permease [Lachnospiraceae bacterium]HCR83609.1 amino acid ABC transporter permease [Lachnospiraceae bacterium]
MSDLNFSVLIQYVHLLPSALLTTIKIGILGFLLALLIAIIVGTLRSIKLPGIISVILTFYVEAFRGTPLLVQLFLVYYGLPAFGIKMTPLVAAILTMGLNSGAYLSENVRAAILAVDKGQYEVAAMLGYTSFQTSVHIVLPQAVRIAIPSFMNGFSSLVKETSIVSILPVVELTKLGNQIYARTYHPFEIYITLGVLYFVLTYFATFFARMLERRMSKWTL